MPENKSTPTTEAKKTDAAAKAPDTTKPIETKQPAVANPPQTPTPVEKKQSEVPKEPPNVPPAPPTTMPPPPPKEVISPKQPVEKSAAAEKPKTTVDDKKPTVAEKPDEKKSGEKDAALPPKVTTPTKPKEQAGKKLEEKEPDVKEPAIDPKPTTEEKKSNEKPAPNDTPKAAPATTPKKDTSEVKPKAEPAKDPKKPEVKAPVAAPKDKVTDTPKKETTTPSIKVTGKDKVEIPIQPKLVEKSAPSTEPKVTQSTPLAKENTSPQGEAKATAEAIPTQAAEGPKGIVISKVFDDRLTPPSAADLKSLPIPEEGEAFSMRLHPAYFFEFLEHPFTINRETKDYKDLYESIKENGIHDPVYCRPRKDGGLEIMSGHRRHDIGTQLNYPIPTIIVQADDDTARIAVVDGNLHRMDIPTSELARAAKMKMEALTRKAGRRSKMDQLTAPQKRSDQQVAEDMGMSRNQVQRLVRIDALVPELKQQVDDKKLPFNTAVELSYMKPDEQKKVVDYMEKEQVTPSMAQATQLKEASKHAETLAKHIPTLAPANQVNEEKIASIIKPKKEPELKVTLTADELRGYFPGKLPTVPEAKRAIFDALDLRKRALEKQAKKQDIKPPAR